MNKPSMDDISVFPVQGQKAEQYIPQLAKLRIEIFREFPYLYDGDLDYEQHYLRRYTASNRCVIIIAKQGDTVIGASTALPLADEDEAFTRPFLAQHYDIDKIFYFGESVLTSAYRGQGIGVRFFELREAHAKALGGFEHFSFCAVQRPTDHPKRPKDYRTLEQFWRNRGYQQHPELVTEFNWKDIDQRQTTSHNMVFWLKYNTPNQ